MRSAPPNPRPYSAKNKRNLWGPWNGSDARILGATQRQNGIVYNPTPEPFQARSFHCKRWSADWLWLRQHRRPPFVSQALGGERASGPARLPMKRPRPRKSAPGGSKIEARGGQNGLLEGFRGAQAVFEAILESILTLPPPLGPPKSSKRALKWDPTSKPFLRRVLQPS